MSDFVLEGISLNMFLYIYALKFYGYEVVVSYDCMCTSQIKS